MEFWEEDHRGKWPPSSGHNEGIYYQHNLSRLMLNFLTWLRWCLSGFCTSNWLFFPPVHVLLFGRKSLCTAQISGVGRCVSLFGGLNICIDYLGFSCTRHLSILSFTSLFNHLFISLWTWGCLFYTWVGIQYYLLHFPPNCSSYHILFLINGTNSCPLQLVHLSNR